MITPMMNQYLQIKDKYKDCIVFFRLGDFYEMFFEDAKIASKELELVLNVDLKKKHLCVAFLMLHHLII